MVRRKVQARGRITLTQGGRRASRTSDGNDVSAQSPAVGMVEIGPIRPLSLAEVLDRHVIDPSELEADPDGWQDVAAADAVRA